MRIYQSNDYSLLQIKEKKLHKFKSTLNKTGIKYTNGNKHTHICIYIYMCVCIYIYTHTHQN